MNSIVTIWITLSSLIFIVGTNNSMEQSPSWEANRSSASQEIPCILRNPKNQYHIYMNPPPVPILN
jgi:hypothetical protein